MAGMLRQAGQFFAQGQVGAAETLAREVLRVQSRQPDALHLLGLIELARNKPAEAERLIRLAMKHGAPHANLMVNLGNACREQGKVEAALAAYDRALEMNPTYHDAMMERGVLFKESQRSREALSEFERLIALRPDDPVAYLRAAETLADLGRFKETISYCEQAMQRMPAPHADLYAMVASTYERMSDLDDAVRWAEKALALQSAHPMALQVWSKARRRALKNDKAVLEQLRLRLEKTDAKTLDGQGGRLIYAELAQICDQLGDTKAAYTYFVKQNDRMAELADQMKMDRTQYMHELEKLIKTFTPQFAAALPKLPAPMLEAGKRAAPVFLVGFPRSGTTLLDQILDAHPDIQVLEELPLVRELRDFAAAERGGYPVSLRNLTVERRARARAIYWAELEKEGADTAHKIVVDKMPLNLVHAALMQQIFPDAKFILALRHPADCVLSCFMQDFVPNASMLNFLTLTGAARLYDRAMSLWQIYMRLLSLNVVTVKYENLVRDLASEVRPVFERLGLPWDDAVLNPAAHAKARGSIRTPSYAQVTEPVHDRALQRWHRYEEQLRPLLPLLQSHAAYFGYEI